MPNIVPTIFYNCHGEGRKKKPQQKLIEGARSSPSQHTSPRMYLAALSLLPLASSPSPFSLGTLCVWVLPHLPFLPLSHPFLCSAFCLVGLMIVMNVAHGTVNVQMNECAYRPNTQTHLHISFPSLYQRGLLLGETFGVGGGEPKPEN